MTEQFDVCCTDTGTWTVHPADDGSLLSSHVSETDAEHAAHEHAAEHRGRVVIHDRYQRVHESPAIADRVHGADSPSERDESGDQPAAEAW